MKNWKELTGNRKEWNKLVEKAKTHPEEGGGGGEEEEEVPRYERLPNKPVVKTI